MAPLAFKALCAGLSFGLTASASMDDAGSMLQKQPVTGIQPVDVALATLSRVMQEPKASGDINVTYNTIMAEPGASVTVHVSDKCDAEFDRETNGGSCNIETSGFSFRKLALGLKMKESLGKKDRLRVSIKAYIQSMGMALPMTMDCGWCEAECSVMMLGSELAKFRMPECSSATEVAFPLTHWIQGGLPPVREKSGRVGESVVASLTIHLDIIRSTFTPYMKSYLVMNIKEDDHPKVPAKSFKRDAR